MIEMFYAVSSLIVVVIAILFLWVSVTGGFCLLTANQIYLFVLHIIFASYLLAMIDVPLITLFSIGILKSWEDKD